MHTTQHLTAAELTVYEALIAIRDNTISTWPQDRIDRLLRAMNEAGRPGVGAAAIELIAQHVRAILAAQVATLSAEKAAGSAMVNFFRNQTVTGRAAAVPELSAVISPSPP